MSIKRKTAITSNSEEIKTSDDHDRFLPHGQQRVIKPGQVKRIISSMKSHGFISAYPISVYRDGDKFRIIDGHHRHAAARSLKIPIHFVMLTKEMEGSLGDVNNGKPWTCLDWARKWALEGKPDFIRLAKYTDRGIPLCVAATLLKGNSASSAGGTRNSLEDGTFTIVSTDQIEALLNVKDQLEGLCPAISSRAFMEAFSMCWLVDHFDIKQLKSRITANPHMLVKTANRQQMLDLLEKIYNHHSGTKIPLAFLAREAMSERAIVKKPRR